MMGVNGIIRTATNREDLSIITITLRLSYFSCPAQSIKDVAASLQTH